MKKYYSLLFCSFIFNFLQAQSIFDIMERKDLPIDQVESFAKKYFDSVGTKKGSGYKQYQRWLYEAKFHLNQDGYPTNTDNEFTTFRNTSATNSNIEAWQDMGPFNWNATGNYFPGVGRITAIAVHPLDSNLIYTCSPGGGLWKSIDGGSGWQPLTDNNASLMNLWSITVDPNNKEIVFIGNANGMVAKSINRGATFTVINAGSGISGGVRKILLDPNNTNTIFVCANSGIYRSTDAGMTWTQVFNQMKEDIEFHPANANIMYASGFGSAAVNVLHISNDYGLTWSPVGLANNNDFGRTLIAVSAANPNRVYVVQAKGLGLGYIFRSDDAGVSFVTKVTGNAATCTNYLGYGNCSDGGQAPYDMACCTNPNNADEIYIAGISCWRSNNGGDNWVPLFNGPSTNDSTYMHIDIHVLEWMKNTLFIGNDGGIYKSKNNGSTCKDLTKGLGIRQFYRMANSPTNTNIFTGGSQDNGGSIRHSNTWVDWLNGDGMDCLISPLDSNLIWGSAQTGYLSLTTTGGQTFTDIGSPSPGNWVTPLAIEEHTNNIYGGYTGVYKSTTLGYYWTKISGNVITNKLEALALAPSDPNFIYASYGNTLYTTTNGGATWSVKTAPAIILMIAVSPLNPSKIWIACNTSGANRACMSTDAGTTFIDISEGLPNLNARSVTVDSDSAESVYYGMNIGVYFMNNYMPWQNITANLPLTGINEVELHRKGKIIRVATYGRGIWQRNAVGGYCGGSTITLPAYITGATYQWERNMGNGFANVNNTFIFSGSSTANLQIQSSTNMYNQQFRCKVTASNGTIQYSQVYTLKFSSNWLGNVDVNWHNPDNWSCGNIPDEFTDVIINAERKHYPFVNQNATIRSLQVAQQARINIAPNVQLEIKNQ